MNTDELNETLSTLHEELSEGQTKLDSEARERLGMLVADIRQALGDEPTPDPEEGEASLTERLQDEITEFEATYPRFSELIGKIAQGLSNMGI